MQNVKVCAPHIGNQSHTCFTQEQLKNMVRQINKYDRDNGIKQKLSEKGSKMALLDGIKKYMSSRCENDICRKEPEYKWIKQEPLKKIGRKLEESFRPQMPYSWKKKPKTWLRTPDIYNVMSQYEKVFPDFLFFGPVPADCPDGIACELSNISLDKFSKKGIKRIGIVYNLDNHNEPGSHWVAVFISIPDNSAEYYDSYAVNPKLSIKNFLENVAKTYKKPLQVKINKNRHQYGGSECGVFSMNYILERLYGVSWEEMQKKKVTDKQMNELRKIFYRP